MAARIAALVALLCLLAFALAAREPPRQSSPSVLEKTCRISTPGTNPSFDPPRSANVPCKALDEYLQTQWSI